MASLQSMLSLGNRQIGSLFTEPIGAAGDAFEREADRAAGAVIAGLAIGPAPFAGGSRGMIQRKCAECEQQEEEKIRRAPKEGVASEYAAPPEPAEAQPTSGHTAETPAAGEPAADTTVAAPALLVDDSAEVSGSQMHKSEFLEVLQAEVHATADEGLAATGRTSADCPWIAYSFSYYQGQGAAQVEQALRRYAPEAGRANSPSEYVSIVTARVRRSVEIWVRTGRISGIPTDVPAGLVPRGGPSEGEGVGAVMPKAKAGGPREAHPGSVRDQLGSGHPLPVSIRSRMESVLGAGFGGVRVHTDARAEQVSGQLNARAFAVGRHVAFGAGEFRPGTIAGDALIAHELAHVVQQGSASVPATGLSGPGAGSFEREADIAASGAVLQQLGATPGRVLPRMRAGLRLQRCNRSSSTASKLPSIPEPAMGQAFGDWMASFPVVPGDRTQITEAVPAELADRLKGADCADVALLLRHYYLKTQGQNFTFRAGGGKGQTFKIGSDADIQQCMGSIGSINFQEERKGFELVGFLKDKGGTKLRNLKQLVAAGLAPGHVLVWRRIPGVHGNFEGHVQTVVRVDPKSQILVVAQGNMSAGKPTSSLEEVNRSFADWTGAPDGDAEFVDRPTSSPEEAFFGAGPWK